MRKAETSIHLSILMPVRNEGLNLKIMLKVLRALVEVPHEILVVYDDDKDNSIDTVLEIQKTYPHLRAVKNNLGRGIPNAIKEGVNHSCGKYILLFAADEMGPVLTIDDMLYLMDEKKCDFVSCTRYAHGGRRLGGSLLGGFASRLANKLFYLFSGCALTDATTGIKMFTRSIYEQLDLRADAVGWSVVFEMSIKAQIAGFRLGEVPIVSIDRLYGGKSTFRFSSWAKEYLKWFISDFSASARWANSALLPHSPAFSSSGRKAKQTGQETEKMKKKSDLNLHTGGTGFIGEALVRKLIEAGHFVRVLDNDFRGTKSRLVDRESN